LGAGGLLTPPAIVGGTNAYFAELNRDRAGIAASDAVAFSVNPQVHAFDNDSLMETPDAQAETVRSAVALSGERPVWVSPVTLKPRFNPNTTADAETPLPDVRQKSLFAAAWTVASLAKLARSGAAGITYFQAVGPNGLMDANGVFPVYSVLEWVGAFADGTTLPVTVSRPDTIAALSLSQGRRTRLLLANLTAYTQAVTLQEQPWHGQELTLPPYGVAKLDSEMEQEKESNL